MSPRRPISPAEIANIHQEHRGLVEGLAALDSALQGLICYSEVYADFASILQVYGACRELSQRVPDHFAREELIILEDLAGFSPEARQFVIAMKHEHLQLQERFEAFCKVLDQIEEAGDLEQAMRELRHKGLEFTRAMAGHLGHEERRFQAFQSCNLD